jgi:hypothetical protein
VKSAFNGGSFWSWNLKSLRLMMMIEGPGTEQE